ncbi:phosphatidylinositol kinase [Paenibacillus sp. N1-5-1-14]|uniref:phosphatidylinositol kinase n=1 Tax=Paenibacillus radicibacter TaxID=2972488 RepID=UPI002158C2C3|nr:phosphatidylinositol kinase [Paenibacillus radicibacter]MCR8644512.1 phosphatidylinositol kinase [Paenibacillus radicibacter]
MDSNYMHQLCMHCMHRYVGIRTHEGHCVDGFIAGIEGNDVILAIPTEQMEERMMGMPAEMNTYRQFGFHPGFFPRRRFFGRRVPLFGITDLFLLPFFL